MSFDLQEALVNNCLLHDARTVGSGCNHDEESGLPRIQIVNTLKEIFSEFGNLGWVELFAGFLVAVGCGGELWILCNKLTRHIEPIGKNAGVFWKSLAWFDTTLRPLFLRLKIGGRKLSEAKEQLLERLFVMSVSLGVGIEFIALMFSLHEAAKLNKEAAQARKDSSEAIERAAKLESTNMAMALKMEELRKENTEFAIAQDPRKINQFALLEALGKTSGLHFVLVNIPDWEANSLAARMEWAFEYEYTLFHERRHWTYSRIVTALDIPDGVHVGFPTPPNPFNQLPAISTREDRMRLNEQAVSAYMNFEPSKACDEAANLLKDTLGSTGIVVDHWGKWLDEKENTVLTKLGISTQTVPTNTVVILIGHKPDPQMVSLLKFRARAFDVQCDTNASWAEVSNAWHEAFVVEDEYRQRQVDLGLRSTNSPHPSFSPTGWNGDGSPVDPKQAHWKHK